MRKICSSRMIACRSEFSCCADVSDDAKRLLKDNAGIAFEQVRCCGCLATVTNSDGGISK